MDVFKSLKSLDTFNFSFMELIKKMTVIIVLYFLEDLLDDNFFCLSDIYWNRVNVAFCFLGPVFLLICLSAGLQERSRICCGRFKCKCSVKTCLSIFYPGACWCVILFLDGRYFVCAMSVNGTEIQFTKEALSKDARLELLMVWSQVSMYHFL